MSWILYSLLFLLVGTIYRLVKGPTIEDRILALNVTAVIVVLIMSLYSITQKSSFYLDIALIYALLSFGEVLAYVKFTSKDILDTSTEE